MSDKIINGIDVSECAYYNEDNEPYCCEIWENECEAQNCYYKQLKRLQQENEELKEKIIKLNEENGNLIINRNTAENKLQDTESRLISIQKANTHNLVLLQRHNNALEEIREINKEFFDMNYGFDEQGISEDVKEVAREIQDKINEALK